MYCVHHQKQVPGYSPKSIITSQKSHMTIKIIQGSRDTCTHRYDYAYRKMN